MRAIPFLCTLLAAAAPAHAQLFRSYLSIAGNDANPCTVSAPCRLLPAALAAVQAGGEVWMLDSANYNAGPVIITKSVTVLAVPSARGSLVALGGPAVEIRTTGTVTLRNLGIRPFPGHELYIGVFGSLSSRLAILDCDISGFTLGTALFTQAADITVERTRIANNGTGVDARAYATVALHDSLLEGNQYGAVARPGPNSAASISVSRSVVRNSSAIGVFSAGGTAGSETRVNVVDSRVEGNVIGIHATAFNPSAGVALVTRTVITGGDVGVGTSGDGSARVTLDGNVITHNATGLQQQGPLPFSSAGNNTVRTNYTNVAGAVVTTAGF